MNSYRLYKDEWFSSISDIYFRFCFSFSIGFHLLFLSHFESLSLSLQYLSLLSYAHSLCLSLLLFLKFLSSVPDPEPLSHTIFIDLFLRPLILLSPSYNPSLLSPSFFFRSFLFSSLFLQPSFMLSLHFSFLLFFSLLRSLHFCPSFIPPIFLHFFLFQILSLFFLPSFYTSHSIPSSSIIFLSSNPLSSLPSPFLHLSF